MCGIYFARVSPWGSPGKYFGSFPDTFFLIYILFGSRLYWYRGVMVLLPFYCFLHLDFPGLGGAAGQELNPAAGQHLGH